MPGTLAGTSALQLLFPLGPGVESPRLLSCLTPVVGFSPCTPARVQGLRGGGG